MTVILELAASGDLTSIEKLTRDATTESEFNSLVRATDFHDNNVVHLACKNGHIDVLTWILSKQPNLINSRNLMGDTPLIIATLYCQKDVVSCLLTYPECNVNFANDHGNTALHYASFRRHKQILQLLINRPVATGSEKLFVYVRNKYGKTPLDRTSTEIRRDISALIFMKEGRVLGKEDSGDPIVRTPQEIADAQEAVKQRFLQSVIPDIEIPFAALNPSKPVSFQSVGNNAGTGSAPEEILPTKQQYMMGTWYMAPVVIRRLGDQMVHQSECRAIRREAEALRSLHHQSLCSVIGVSLQTPNVSFICEFVGSNSLHSVIYDPEVEMDVEQVMRYACEIIGGIKYLHEQAPPIYHLNLNAKNVMITDGGDGVPTVKLTEYGHQDTPFRSWSAFLENSQRIDSFQTKQQKDENEKEWNVLLKTMEIEYLSPELLSTSPLQNAYAITEFGAIDVYAFGILFLEIIVRDRVYPGLDAAGIVETVNRRDFEGPNIPEFVPQDLQELLGSCFKRNPSTRITSDALETLLVGLKVE
ncbi:kinase-like domain-containing protein [Obelidium mucronatum]|nr:kinase-like domain-containing protein [Obelidium mucronatum]